MASLQHSSAQFLYGTLYSLIYVVLLALLLVTPADAIDQALRAPLDRQYYIIWVVAVCFVLTLLIVVFIYALRLYGNTSALAAIPRAWVPVGPGDVADKVYKVVETGLEKSASVAWRARPRVGGASCAPPPPPPPRNAVSFSTVGSRLSGGSGRRVRNEVRIETPPPPSSSASNWQPVWGYIEHNGWTSSISSTTLPPLLSYDAVISELPTLAEAKALTLAPASLLPHNQLLPPREHADPLDPAAMQLLRRAEHHSLRAYLGHLATLGVVVAEDTSAFLTLYEHARFSTAALSHTDFCELMRLFADVLKSMKPLEGDVVRAYAYGLADEYLDSDHDDYYDEYETTGGGDIDNDAPRSDGPSTPRSAGTSRHYTTHDGVADFVFPPRPTKPMVRTASAGPANRTAPATPKTGSSFFASVVAGTPTTPTPPRLRNVRTDPLTVTTANLESSPHSRTIRRAQQHTPHQYTPTPAPLRSSTSLRLARTTSASSSAGRPSMGSQHSSSTAGSVIRLALDGEEGDMPFVFTGEGYRF